MTGLQRHKPWIPTPEQVDRYHSRQRERRHAAALAALHRRSTVLQRAPQIRRPRNTGPSKKIRDLIREERAQYRCEVSGVWLGKTGHIHHRRPRRIGGDRRPDTNAAQNLLLLHPDAHQWIEDNRAEAHRLGLLLHDKQDPLTTTARLRHGDVLLDAAGGWRLDDTTNPTTGEAAA